MLVHPLTLKEKFPKKIPKLTVLFYQSKAGTMKVEPMQYTGETLKDASDDCPIIHPCITLAFLDKADYRISLSNIYVFVHHTVLFVQPNLFKQLET